MVIEVVQYCLATLLGTLIGYPLLLSFFALKGKKSDTFATTRNRKFAILILSQNHGNVISKSLYSLSGLVYPKNMFDLIVIADRCNDNTAEIAKNLGAIVWERLEEDGSKERTLHWAFEQVVSSQQAYEAVIVFDANSLVCANYLEVMNYYLENGSKVVQSSEFILSQSSAGAIEAKRIEFLFNNYIKPMGRKVLGLSMGLRCNGICISRELLKENRWPQWLLNSNGELGLILELEGVKKDFAPEAQVYHEVAGESGKSEETRKINRFSIQRKYFPKFLKAAFKKRSFQYLDNLIELVTPPLRYMLLIILLMLVVNIALWFLGWETVSFIWLWTGITGLAVSYLLVGLAAAGADRQVYKSLFYMPLHLLWQFKTKLDKPSSKERKKMSTPAKERDMASPS